MLASWRSDEVYLEAEEKKAGIRTPGVRSFIQGCVVMTALHLSQNIRNERPQSST